LPLTTELSSVSVPALAIPPPKMNPLPPLIVRPVTLTVFPEIDGEDDA
jgi:hypothetical protein